MSSTKAVQKIVILGNAAVGKTCLMERYISGRFSTSYKTTIGADFSTKDVQIGDVLATLQLWDTAGQERFQSLGLAFYRGADACVLVYDISDAQSFAKLDYWRDEFIRAADIAGAREFPFVVLGNKSDLDASKHVVSQTEVQAWCDAKGGIPHFLVSAKTGFNIDDAFLSVVKAAMKRVKDEMPVIPDTLKIDAAATKPEASGCAC